MKQEMVRFFGFMDKPLGEDQEVESRVPSEVELIHRAYSFQFYSIEITEVGGRTAKSEPFDESPIYYPNCFLMDRNQMLNLMVSTTGFNDESGHRFAYRDMLKDEAEYYIYRYRKNGKNITPVSTFTVGKEVLGDVKYVPSEKFNFLEGMKIREHVEEGIIKYVIGEEFLITVENGLPVIKLGSETRRSVTNPGARIYFDPEVFTKEAPIRLAHSLECPGVEEKGRCDRCHAYWTLHKNGKRIFFSPHEKGCYGYNEIGLLASGIGDGYRNNFVFDQFPDVAYLEDLASKLRADPLGDTVIATDQPLILTHGYLWFEVRWMDKKWMVKWNIASNLLAIKVIE